MAPAPMRNAVKYSAASFGKGCSRTGLDLLRSFCLTGAGEPRKALASKAACQSDPTLLPFLLRLQDRIVALEQMRKAVAVAELTEAIVIVALAVVEEYDRLKRTRAALDYDDLIVATRDLLLRKDAAAWVLYKLDGGIDHILVDEAQDTSPEQWRIVGQLVVEFFAGKGAHEGIRTLFAVGDEKQSIFSFQGAAPEEFGVNRSLFRGRAKAANLAFEDAHPAVSRRGATAILKFVDAVFAQDAARDGLTFADEPIRHQAERQETGRVEVWPAIKPPTDADDDPWLPVDAPPKRGAHVLLAQGIAARIKGWLRDGARIPSTGKSVTPGAIMILVRRRNAFAEEMIRQLIERDIPVAGADRMVLTQQIAIQDLVALGRFALLPEDDLTLASLLKSPFVDFAENEVFDLAYGREHSLWVALSARKDERPVFAGAHAFLSAALAAADFAPPFEFYANILGRGVRRRIVARLGDEAADAIDEFLALALIHEGLHPPSLESFLDWFEKGASDVKRDMEQGGGAVRVMTVHGAKGLEANIVILPDTAQIPVEESRAGLLYTDDCVFFSVPKPMETPAITAAKAAAHAREMREYRRLLYVALTRARDWLILCGYETKRGVHPSLWHPLLEEAARKRRRTDRFRRHLGSRSRRCRHVGRRRPGGCAGENRPSRVLSRERAKGTAGAADLASLRRRGRGRAGAHFASRRTRANAVPARGLLIHALLAALPNAPENTRP